MAQQTSNSGDALALRQWMESEATKQNSSPALLLHKTTIAYGIAELLRHARSHPAAAPSSLSIVEQCDIRNFAVRLSDHGAAGATGRLSQLKSSDDINGVVMLSPQLSVSIVEPPFLCGGGDDQGDEIVGRYLEVEFSTCSGDTASSAVSQVEEDTRCHSLGVLLHELFLPRFLLPGQGNSPENELNNIDASSHSRAQKKMRLFHSALNSSATPPSLAQKMNKGHQESNLTSQPTAYRPLLDLAIPASISLLLQNLIECREENRPEDAYDSLEGVIQDLHLLLLDPSRFLFDCVPPLENGNMQLSFRKHKLYGRENEMSLITDAFCRVSYGKSEAFFIGGFSGSGKSRLVNSLKARVDIAEGYVITHKFDQMSEESPLMEVISIFNDLCLLILKKRSQSEIRAISMKLMDVFGTDFSVLARLLPNVGTLFPPLDESVSQKESGDQIHNVLAVCFVLQRFMRVVSSQSHPVLLFLDDLQWCDKSSLTVVEGIVCDTMGSSCLFFVGSYRSNEVQDDHVLFPFMESLTSSGIPITKLSLEGLKPEDLNTMISDAMCMFPRICEPLSDVVFQKTNGNPLFALSFLKTLVDEGLLEYSVSKKGWVWDEDGISSMDIAGNVLCLLSSKMIGLSEDAQLALKVVACFGKIKESVVEYLRVTSQYSNIRDGLEQAFNKGLMIKVGTSCWKFVHDKVREAAYSLIPDSEKKQYHHSLGMSLYSITKGSDTDDIIFSIADQINHGIDNIPIQSHALRHDIAELNEMAGVKAVGCSDYVTSRSYFNTALTLLPTDHWESHYTQSLRLSFLLAKSAYSCGDVDEAYDTLQQTLHHTRCLSDKLEAYHLLVVSLHDRGKLEEAYTMTKDVMLQLGEEVPDTMGKTETKKMVKETKQMVKVILRSTPEEYFLGTRDVERNIELLLKFYSIITMWSFSAKPRMVPVFACRMVSLSVKHGVCKYSIMENLRRGFECGIASGDTSSGLWNTIHDIRISLGAGEDLPTLLKRTEYYLEVTKRYSITIAKVYLVPYRDTILMLMGKECNSNVQDDALNIPAETTNYHKAIRAYWMGHSERCHYFTEKIVAGNEGGRHLKRFFMLYYGLNSVKIVAKRKTSQKLKAVPCGALKALKEAAGYSRWNFRNKFHLLEAEILSFDGKHDEAKQSYAAAITSARCSRFIHEQGLAYELAGVHCTNIGDYRSAWTCFNHAKQCYSEWGSQMKVDSIARRLESFQISLAPS